MRLAEVERDAAQAADHLAEARLALHRRGWQSRSGRTYAHPTRDGERITIDPTNGTWTHIEGAGRRVVGFGRLLDGHLEPRRGASIGDSGIPS